MFVRLIRKIGLLFKPIRKGDIFYGDPVWFVIPRSMEQILHGLKDKYGNNLYEPIPNLGCFRLIVENTNRPTYYVLSTEVFCKSKNSNMSVWMKRTHPRLMSKDTLERFILAGILWRE